MSETVLVDTEFWIALFDPRKPEPHAAAVARADYLELAALVVPWPILYETLRTRFVRRREWTTQLDQRLKRPDVVFVDDQPYRDDAYTLTIEYSTRWRRPISMTDMLCRLLIADREVQIDYLLTNNRSDFEDVCLERGVEILT